ncbi:MAG: hypothetical protein ACP5OZ_03595 [Candidatus Woesearchaeota archaeon]
MINKLNGFSLIEKLRLERPNWTIVKADISENIVNSLEDNLVYTVRTAVESGDDFGLPRFVGLTGRDIKDRINELLSEFETLEGVYLIIYPYFKAEFSGNILIKFGLRTSAVVESCEGSLWNLTENSIVDYKGVLEFNDSFEILKDVSNIPHWNELKEIIIKISRELKKLVSEREIIVEWSYTGEKFIFYELKSID